MNASFITTSLIAVAAAVGSVNSLAQEGSPSAAELQARQPVAQATGSSLTRAQVVAEMQQARARGALLTGEVGSDVPAFVTRSTLSREEVRAEAVKALHNGTLVLGEAS
ncbi:MAG: DUF4148 domain-containing protein [Burkholderiaceae bacterium]|nr:DUF4148 domain-containing protein [Burkholderiaceae bacterium]